MPPCREPCYPSAVPKHLRALAVGWFVLACASAAQAQTTVPDANPARPTVATPATLTPVGYLQFENGILFAWNSPEFSRQFSVNQVTKLAVHPRLQLIAQSEPVALSALGGSSSVAPGGVALGAQFVISPGEKARPTVAVSYLRSVYGGAAPDIDIGSFEHSATLLVSGDWFGFHADINGIANEQVDGRIRRAQFGETLSVSHPLGRFTVSGELWHFTQPLQRGYTIGNLWALSYPVKRNLIVDAGFNRGFTGTSTRWEVFAGFTYLLPKRLWRR